MTTVEWFDLPAIALEVIDEVSATGKPITITKDGRAVLRLEPIDEATRREFKALGQSGDEESLTEIG
jgi:prevent-host-death family protein